MRFGYEFAAPAYVLYSLNVETDFRRRVMVVPTVVISTPVLLWWLGFAGGVGVPINLLGERDVGVRWQIEIGAMMMTAVVLSWDLFPGYRAGDPGHFQFTLMGRITI